ncbi:hypothetical protein FVER53590_27534 [Fusarium verticillioides]|nr:hypothetical protein FVER53590_27534 [Fusarium verticillioides]
MDSIATTKAEADAHLETLRQKRGVGRGQQEESVLVQSLDQALKIVSDQLYKASTHFILELIQNADDNQYGSEIVPSLRLALYRNESQGYFRSDCNEVGFTVKQLDALTRVGQSTKAASINDSKSYIGEKGIGFKSVFKVADVVHVASGLYEFKFDRNNRIGMILPITSQFPTADRVVDHTQFLLELKSQRDYDIIKKELNSIEPDLLLFLRNLHQVHISTYGSNKVYRRKTTKFDARYKGEAVEISVQSDDITSKEFIVHRHVVEKLPPEPQREGVVSSEVVLAFIVDSEANPVANTQKVFAFLPVDDFGFRFLIHADFILVANREGLNESSLRNWSLRDEIQTAFVDAIHRLVSLSPTRDGEGLCYKWPKYLPRYHGTSGFCAEWHFLRSHDVMDLLQAIRLQWDRKGMLSPIIIKAAAELQVPGSDGRCRPLGRLAILTPELKQKCPHLDFVSLPDPECNWEFLSILGVLTTCNTAVTLRELQKLAQLQTDEVDKDAVRKIYEKLNASMQSEWKQISTVFREQPLVLVQKPEPRWLDHLSCVWDAPGALKQVTRLRNRYPTCRQLFISILGVRQASTEDIVEELCSVSDEGDLVVQRFSELFFLLKEYVVDHEELSKDQVRRIREAAVFPIVVEGGSSDEQPRITRQSICEGNWYVPDEVHLEQAFRCRVAMLSMRVKDVKTLHELFENLDCKQIFLSCAVGQSTELKGTCIRDLRREGDLMIRLDYLAEIGFLGESFVYRMIQPHIKDWTYENWTSKLRVEAGHPRFTEREKDFSDFTYQDRFGQMKILLQEAGVDVVAGWSHDTTFHLEVKATLGPCSEPCFVSQNQLDKMRQYEGDLANVYILIRVFQMEAEGGPDFRLFVNPWSLYLTGALEFRSSEGYKVYGLM